MSTVIAKCLGSEWTKAESRKDGIEIPSVKIFAFEDAHGTRHSYVPAPNEELVPDASYELVYADGGFLQGFIEEARPA